MIFQIMEDEFIKKTIELSKKSAQIGGYPAGAVIVRNREIIAEGLSDGKQLCDATIHAETAAIREASEKLERRNLDDVVLYTSLEPCLMCYAATFWAHIPKVVYACSRDRVSVKYYEGFHNIHEVNKSSLRTIQLVHAQQFEDDALRVIHEWEKENGK